MFGAQVAFFAKISDPIVGGTYMTLLNTLSNIGGTWPGFFVFRAVDTLTEASCSVPTLTGMVATSCVSEEGKRACEAAGASCITHRDGYYSTSLIAIGLGALLLGVFLRRAVARLERAPVSSWRLQKLPRE